MKIRIQISKLRENAAQRGDVNLEEFLSKGQIRGEFLEVDPPIYLEFWNRYQRRDTAKSVKGVGDIVAKLAQPIARSIDRVLGTDIEHCGGCQRRKEKLNKLMPFSGSIS